MLRELLIHQGSWSASTRRPPAYEAGALPAELQERVRPYGQSCAGLLCLGYCDDAGGGT